MTAENGHGTSRRAFLGQAAGAAAVVAGAGVGAGVIAQSAAAADKRSYSAGHFALSLDGAGCGKFPGIDGGNLTSEVVNDAIGVDYYQKKHVANFKWSECSFQVGSGMGKGMYDWIQQSFDRKSSARNRASMVTVGTRGEEVFRRSFNNALITEVSFPKLDLASTSVGQIGVTLSSQDVTDRKPSGQGVLGQKAKAWMCANFTFQIDGFNSRIAKVDSFTWKCSIAPDGSPVLEVENIVVTCDDASAPDWQHWLANQQAGGDERNGTLKILGASAGGAVTLSLGNLGVFAVRPDHAPGQLRNGRIKAEMYCEDIKFNYQPSWA